MSHYRRTMFPGIKGKDWWSWENAEGREVREQCARVALQDLLRFFKEEGGEAAVYDGTNINRERREMVKNVLEREAEESGMMIELVWIESICKDQNIVEANIRETKLTSPDYISTPHSSEEINHLTNDYLQRIKQYEKYYETLEEDSPHPYVKIVDVGRQVHTNRIYGYLCGKIVFFLMNLRPTRAPIYISRHGESEFNVRGLIGGDSDLSERGRAYARALADFIEQEEEFSSSSSSLVVWTSTLKRTIQTAAHLHFPQVRWRALIEIEVGTCTNMTYEDIEERFPDEYKARKKDKLRYRYPQGESYLDVVQRLEPVIFELERMQTPILLIVHRAVARCLLSYFADFDQSEIPHLDIPLHTLIKLSPKAYGCDITKFRLNVPSVDDESGRKEKEEEVRKEKGHALVSG